MNWKLDLLWEKNSDKLYAINGRGLPVFILFHGDTLIQVGSCPEFIKSTIKEIERVPDIYVVTPPVVNILGDNWSGFEFPLWRARFMDFMNPQQVSMIGYADHVKSVYRRLSLGMFGDFVTDNYGNPQSHWVPKSWVDDVLTPAYNPDYSIGDWKFIFSEDNVMITNGDYKFDWKKEFSRLQNMPEFEKRSEHTFVDQEFGVLVTGNGVGSRIGNTSSFLVKMAQKSYWIDPPAYPIHKSGELGIAPDKIDALIITHVHEDHIEGFASWYAYLADGNKKLALYTDDQVFRQLKTIFNPMVVDIEKVFEYHNVRELENTGLWKFRKNYHTIPTLGLKITNGDKGIAISGDTIYNENIARYRYLNKEISFQEMLDLSSYFFKGCQIIFHDTNVAGDPVHTPLRSVESLMELYPDTQIYSYHLFEPIESELISKSETGKFYSP